MDKSNSQGREGSGEMLNVYKYKYIDLGSIIN